MPSRAAASGTCLSYRLSAKIPTLTSFAGDDEAARRALVLLRSSAGSARGGISAENRLRLELQLPPLPLRSARDLLQPQD